MKEKLSIFTAAVVITSLTFFSCSKDDELISEDQESLKATKTITSTIVVPAGTTYDGGGVTIIASGMGDGSQNEGQKPIFKLMDGAVLKNVVIGAPGCDGIHTYGNASLNNVTWSDVGEDALTVKEGSLSKSVNLTNCKAYKAYDKVIQINAPINLKMNNFYVDTFGKVVRQNGGTTWQCNIYFNGGTFKNGTNLARTDSKTTQIRYRNMTVSNVSKWWYVPSTSQVKTY